MDIQSKGMSRRSFLGAGAVVAAGAAFAGLTGCSPSGESKSASSASSATEAKAETRDLGSASFEITSDTKQADETKDVDIVVVGSGMGGFSAALSTPKPRHARPPLAPRPIRRA